MYRNRTRLYDWSNLTYSEVQEQLADLRESGRDLEFADGFSEQNRNDCWE